MKTKLKKTQKQIPQKQTIAILGEGATEKHYFDQLKDNEKIRLDKKNLTILPKKAPSKGYKCTEIIDKAIEQIDGSDVDFVFCVFDNDTICNKVKNKENFKSKMKELQQFREKYNKNKRNPDKLSLYTFPDYPVSYDKLSPKAIFIIKNMPCLEYWYLLHFKRIDRHFKTCQDVETLINNKRRGYIPGYEKTNKYYCNHDIYHLLRDKLSIAINSAKSINNNRLDDVKKAQSFSDLYALFEFLGII